MQGVLLDQFGVLHDGKVPYPGAVEAVEFLHSQGVRLLIISNSSRRAPEALRNIAKLGFDASHFAGVVTSGEVAHRQLEQRPTAFWQQLGRRCLHFTWAARGAISLDGLGLEVTQDPQAADFILAHGTEALGTPASTFAAGTDHSSGATAAAAAAHAVPDGMPPDNTGNGSSSPARSSSGSTVASTPCSLEQLRELMARCAERSKRSGHSVPMVVANPDLVTVHGSELRVMPGTLARQYQEMGGEVHLMGKPAPLIYEEALTLLALPAAEVIAIGDSMEHDIAGARDAAVDSLLIAGGIHATDLLSPDGLTLQEDGLLRLSARYSATPSYFLPWFRLA
ncbi:hypothetical protein N2152v2_002054 [Parachlorella kessleri]